jgi:hypothetical protein
MRFDRLFSSAESNRLAYSASCAATDSQKINRLRHRARRAFLSSEATTLRALSSPCWLCKCFAAFAAALKHDTFCLSHILPNPTRNETVAVNVGFDYKVRCSPRALSRDTVTS